MSEREIASLQRDRSRRGRTPTVIVGILIGGVVAALCAPPLPAQAAMVATTAPAALRAFPDPYCALAFPQGVEPITRVVVSGIDNTSPAATTGSAPLEDFLAVGGGLVQAGQTYQIEVEGNTDGDWDDVVNAFIDWNRNGVFDSNEAYAIGDITNSTGVDGQQAVNTILVPPGVTPGAVRLRVIKRYSAAATACETTGYGQGEDYTLTVAAGATYTVTPSVGLPVGTISPSGPQTIAAGAVATFSLFPATGYHVGTVGGTCGGTLNGNAYTTAPVSANCTVVANFALDGSPADPLVSLSPATFTFSVPANQVTSATLSIANALGHAPLTYSLAARETSAPLVPVQVHAVAASGMGLPPALALGGNAGGDPRPAAWLAPLADYTFALDDGTYEDTVGVGTPGPPATESAAVWLNRFAVPEPVTIDTIAILWPGNSNGTLVGLQANLVVYYDADADGDPNNAVRIGGDELVTIAALDSFQTYPVHFVVPGPGHVYIGFVDQWAIAGGYTPRLFPAALDQGSSAGKSWLIGSTVPPTDIDHLGNNDLTGVTDRFGIPGNWLIRATAAGNGGPTPCNGAPLIWLTANPTSGTVAGGTSSSVTVTVDPAAAGLAPGSHAAELCVTTNDPVHPLLAIPVSVTVGAAVDYIFCSGFELGETGACLPP